MSSTGAPRCPACDDQAYDCDACGGRALAPLTGAAALRGGRWAEEVVARLAGRWPRRWPRSPRALVIASRRVHDLAPDREERRRRLARVCLDAAARRYVELVGFLLRQRLRLPRGDGEEPPGGDEGDTPG